jgi:SAM-dependent methyltransferase
MSNNTDTLKVGFRFAESERWKKAIPKVKPFLGHFTEGDVVLDAGCGVGIELNTVSARVNYSVGLDIDLSNLKIARRFLARRVKTIDFVQADICFLPFRPLSFSKILCLDVLEHLTRPKQVVKGLKSILRLGGECFIRVPNKFTLGEFLEMLVSKLRRSEDLWNVRHVSFFSLNEIVELFQNEGFSYVSGYTTGGFISNVFTSLLTIASVLLNILFYNNYYKCRYYFKALSRSHPRSNIFLVKGASRFPSFYYFTIVFRY